MHPEVEAAIAYAREQARADHLSIVQTSHLFMGLTERCPAVVDLLKALGQDPAKIRAMFRGALGRGDAPAGVAPGETTRFRRVLENAGKKAKTRGPEAATGLDVLIAILEEGEDSVTWKLLAGVGATPAQLLERARKQQIEPPAPAKSTPLLDRLGRDLTALARRGEIKPIVGRKEELRQVVRALLQNRHPVLLGEAGVGKTAIVEGLAARVVRGPVDVRLRNLRIIELTAAELVAGTEIVGQFEERMQKLIAEASSDPALVLFIDEIHTLVGAGRARGHALDVANILKPALARGEIRLIGATTVDEYRRYIEADPALKRRFYPVRVEEMPRDESIALVLEKREDYERRFNLRIHQDACEAAVNLAIKYIPDEHLPAKAVALLEAACGRAMLVSLSPGEGVGEVAASDIAVEVARRTGIPLERLSEGEREKLFKLEEALARRVIGQPEAVRVVAERVRMARAGLRDARRPIGVFLFVGPTGVGKTELARALAEEVYGDERHMLRLDMSEIKDHWWVTRLTGVPPGYVGQENEGQLTGWLRTRPHSLVLLDEIEKAYPTALDLFLQVFDAGRIADAKGREVDASNAIFIMTSNVGAMPEAKRPLGFGRKPVPPPDPTAEIRAELRHYFRPEFLNRIDAIVRFNPLSEANLIEIARLECNRVIERAATQGVTVHVSDEAIRWLARRAYDPAMGARPVKRAVEEHIERPLADWVLRGQPSDMEVRLEGDGLRLTATKQENER